MIDNISQSSTTIFFTTGAVYQYGSHRGCNFNFEYRAALIIFIVKILFRYSTSHAELVDK